MSLKQGGCLRGCVEEVQCARFERSLRREAYNNSVSLCSPGFQACIIVILRCALTHTNKRCLTQYGTYETSRRFLTLLRRSRPDVVRSKGNLRRCPKIKYLEIRIVSQDTGIIAASNTTSCSGVGSSKCVRRDSEWTRLEGDNANSCTI